MFRDVEVLEPTQKELDTLREAARTNWRNVDASIFGTLFERALDPDKRSQLGAHYTSRQDIQDLLEPVLLRPWRGEWSALRDRLTPLLEDATPLELIEQEVNDFGLRLTSLRVLDPACGSGNFLYIALQSLKDIEQDVRVWTRDAGLKDDFSSITPANFCGIELNVYAHDLAATTLQIGWLQWLKLNGAPTPPEPILQAPVNIQNRDALLDIPDREELSTAREAPWPLCDVIVGNPPFLGDKKMKEAFKDMPGYLNTLRRIYDSRVPGNADLVCYWFEKARAQIDSGQAKRAGLVATQSIRNGANRVVLDRIKQSGDIFFGVSNRDWNTGRVKTKRARGAKTEKTTRVHISMVGFDRGDESTRVLDGKQTANINSDLTSELNMTEAKPLVENEALCFLGVMKSGNFNLPEADALAMLLSPNVHGLPNSDVLRPRMTADALLGRGDGDWIIDFGSMTEAEAELYEAPFAYIKKHTTPKDEGDKTTTKKWWLHGRSRPALRAALEPFSRFIVTPETSKHRIFVWLPAFYLPDHRTRAFSRDTDQFFGILHSRVHEVWMLTNGKRLEDRPVYTGERFDSFPFPQLTAEQATEIAEAARQLYNRRQAWLNPPEWLRDEEFTFRASITGPWRHVLHSLDGNGIGTAVYTRKVMRDPNLTVSASKFNSKTREWRPSIEKLQDVLPRRTLTMLYNERPAWLNSAHASLDAAVCAVYGLPADASDDMILAHLLSLNAARAAST